MKNIITNLLSIKHTNSNLTKTKKNSHRIVNAILLSIVSVIWMPSAFASDAAWVFAHRANSGGAVRAADNHNSVNAIEIDITHRSKINLSSGNFCNREWCAFHGPTAGLGGADRIATNLTTVLRQARRSDTIHAVWLDVKDIDMEPEDYTSLINDVMTELDYDEGRPQLKKFWGMYHPDGLSATKDSNYVKALVNKFTIWNSLFLNYFNQNNVFIFDINHKFKDINGSKIIDDNGVIQAEIVNSFCADIGVNKNIKIRPGWMNGMQCGLSTGNTFLGSFVDPSLLVNRLENKLRLTHINSLFLWTFNWGFFDGTEDDLMRLLFNEEDYYEGMAGEWHYGLRGNGVIVGYKNKFYDSGFCDNTDTYDACSYAEEQIENGPNSMGTRSSNIGLPRD